MGMFCSSVVRCVIRLHANRNGLDKNVGFQPKVGVFKMLAAVAVDIEMLCHKLRGDNVDRISTQF